MAGRRERQRARAASDNKPPTRQLQAALLILPWVILAIAAIVGFHQSIKWPVKKTAAEKAQVVCVEGDDGHNYKQLVAKLGGQALLGNVELGSFEGVRGLRAKHRIAAGQPVLSVPYHLSLSIATSSASAAAARVTTTWREVEDGDVQLDTLALIYEAYVKGSGATVPGAGAGAGDGAGAGVEAGEGDAATAAGGEAGPTGADGSTGSGGGAGAAGAGGGAGAAAGAGGGGGTGWLAAYLCTLPRQYDLPVWWRDAWSVEAAGVLPELVRLVTKRRAQVRQFEAMTRDAVAAMPGGAARLKRDVNARGKDSFTRTFAWAYAATKTRTVTLDMEQKLGQEAVLPPGLNWLGEMGVMVPVLDLANHAPASLATSYFAVDMTRNSLTQGRAPVFSLVAARDIEAGEQITFSYLPEDDESPRCNERWLVEYGFVVSDGRPERDCFALTLEDVAGALATTPHLAAASPIRPTPVTQPEWLTTLIQSAQQQQGFPTQMSVQLPGRTEAGKLQLADVAGWAGASAGIPIGEVAGQVLCGALEVRLVRLQGQLARSQEAAKAGDGPGGYRQVALLQVLQGAVAAAQRAQGVAGCSG